MGNSSSSSVVVKKGLIVGINYTGSSCELNGCINDTHNLTQFLVKNNYFAETELTTMDDLTPDDRYPNKTNMMAQIQELVKFAKEHEHERVCLFFSYSGHGSQVRDLNGDEEDGQDEVLCPIDWETNGFIVDDDLRKSLINHLGSHVTLVVLVDACHSGTMLDLKYMYSCDHKNTYKCYGKYRDTKCKVIMISGCRDDQTSSDADIMDKVTKTEEYQGAMTASFLANYKDEIKTKTLINGMRQWLKDNKYQQIPQLTSGQLLDVSKPFMLSVYNDG
jgi:hypothetical protein